MKREIIIDETSVVIRCDKNELLFGMNGSESWVIQIKEHSVPNDKAKVLNLILHRADIEAIKAFIKDKFK